MKNEEMNTELTETRIHNIEMVLTVNRDQVEMLKRRGITPADIRGLCRIATNSVMPEWTKGGVKKVKALEWYEERSGQRSRNSAVTPGAIPALLFDSVLECNLAYDVLVPHTINDAELFEQARAREVLLSKCMEHVPDDLKKAILDLGIEPPDDPG